MASDGASRCAILGVSAFYHDAAAALVSTSGDILFAAHEERYTRRKHDRSTPFHAMRAAVRFAAAEGWTIDEVAYYEDAALKADRKAHILSDLSDTAPKAHARLTAAPAVDERAAIRDAVGRLLGPQTQIAFDGLHHLSHACSAFLPSGFDEALTVVLDGVGEWDTGSAYQCRGRNLEKIWERRFPDSIGLFYSAMTQLAGFKVNSGEYKLMGLAPYGEPVFLDAFLQHVISPRPAPDYFTLNLAMFDFLRGRRMVSDALLALVGLDALPAEGALAKVHLDIAASAQAALEIVTGALVDDLLARTGQGRLCLAGGVALNCVNNAKLRALPGVDALFIQPAAGDAGGALGAALRRASTRPEFTPRPMTTVCLGSAYSQETAAEALARAGVRCWRRPDPADAYVREVAALLAQGQVGGWFQGRSEFGPRALGARSILARADDAGMQQRVNLKVKFRESFRPFAPSMLADDAAAVFDGCEASPYMLQTFTVRGADPVGPVRDDAVDEPRILTHLAQTGGRYPAVTHVDGSARVQTVSEDNGAFYDLLVAYKAATGTSVVINTSFNVRGEPIVETPSDAVDCFLGTDLDFLAIEGLIVSKADVDAELLDAARTRRIFARD